MERVAIAHGRVLVDEQGVLRCVPDEGGLDLGFKVTKKK